MTKLELITFAICSVVTTVTGFDFIVFVLKSAPKTSYFSKLTWRIGLLTTVALVYWYMNNMRFI